MPYRSFRELAGESGSVNSAFQTSYSKTFLIEVDSATDSVFYVGSHPQLPLLYSQHPADNRAYCVMVHDAGCRWCRWHAGGFRQSIR